MSLNSYSSKPSLLKEEIFLASLAIATSDYSDRIIGFAKRPDTTVPGQRAKKEHFELSLKKRFEGRRKCWCDLDDGHLKFSLCLYWHKLENLLDGP